MTHQPHTLPLRALAAAEEDRERSTTAQLHGLRTALAKTLGQLPALAVYEDDGEFPTATIDGLVFRRSAQGDYLRLLGKCPDCGGSAWSPGCSSLARIGHYLEHFTPDEDHVCLGESGGPLGARFVALLDEWHRQNCECGS